MAKTIVVCPRCGAENLVYSPTDLRRVFHLPSLIYVCDACYAYLATGTRPWYFWPAFLFVRTTTLLGYMFVGVAMAAFLLMFATFTFWEDFYALRNPRWVVLPFYLAGGLGGAVLWYRGIRAKRRGQVVTTVRMRAGSWIALGLLLLLLLVGTWLAT